MKLLSTQTGPLLHADLSIITALPIVRAALSRLRCILATFSPADIQGRPLGDRVLVAE
jgi:hypothetical protein